MTPIEAQASGRPVIAYGHGGALETVAGFYPGEDVNPEESTGVFFAEQSVNALIGAILAFESAESQFSSAAIARSAARFSTDRFKQEMADFVAAHIEQFRSSSQPRLEPTLR